MPDSKRYWDVSPTERADASLQRMTDGGSLAALVDEWD